MNNSVAIWADNPPQKSDLHINFWIIKRKFFFRDHFLDFGIKLINSSGGLVKFYIPIEKISDSILEVGGELKDRLLANALFNENCKVTSSTGKRIEIVLPNEKLTVFVFDLKNDIKSEQKYDGTLFTINIPKENKNWYIRFRIKIPYKQAILNLLTMRLWRTIRSSFSKTLTPGGSFYQSVRSSIEAVDFRINDKKSMNLSLLDDNQNNFLSIRKLHFLAIYDSDEDFIFSTLKPKTGRLLENDVWEKYLSGVSGDDRKYCAMHWTCSPNAEEGWEIFFKLRFGSANIITIGWYLILISILAFTINVLSASAYAHRTDIMDALEKLYNYYGF